MKDPKGYICTVFVKFILLKLKLKKKLYYMFRVNINGGSQTIERVAISKNYRGAHWRQEKCGKGRNGEIIRHKYICEL